MLALESLGDLDIFIIFFLSLMLAIVFLIIMIVEKSKEITKLKSKVKDKAKQLEAMDEQAQLIVKTDLELSQTQEELDSKIGSLMALQNLSQALSSSFEEDKIFSYINDEIIHKLGFEMCLIVVNKGEDLLVKKCLGCKKMKNIDNLLQWIKKENFLFTLSEQKIIHDGSSSKFDYFKDYLQDIFGLKTFVVSAIQIKDKFSGFVLLGDYIQGQDTKGSRGIVEILSTQLAQTLENINLFEQLYQAQQDLQYKIKERTQDLEKALKKVKKASNLKTEFVSAVSHEFRTPLTSIKGYASLLIQNKFGKLPDTIRIRLERINQQADNLVGMINDLLDISRIESGRLKVNIEEVNLTGLIKSVNDYLFPQLEKKGIKLGTSLDPELKIQADEQLIQRAVINILNNAIKFTPEKKKIVVSARDRNNHVEISVTDQGPGISQKDRENIFKEFYRTDDASGIEGSGLGLSLVRNIVEMHKGDIKVESTLGQGSTFTLIFPKQQNQPKSKE